MTLADHEIDNLAGLDSTPKASLPLLTHQQKSEMLDPPEPWYAQRRTQLAIVAAIVAPGGWLLYTLFSGGGSPATKVAQTPISQNEQLLKQQLETEQQARKASEKDAAFGKQSDIAAAATVKPGVKVPGKVPPASAPPPQMVSRGPVVIRQSSAPTVTRSYRELPDVIPVRQSASYVRPSYSSPVAFTPSVPKEDPEAAWKRLAELGSYGGSGFSPVAASNPAYTPAVYSQPAYNSVIESEYMPSADTQPGSYTPDTSVPSMGVSVAAGTQAKAELSTPILWAQDIDIKDDEFLVKLTQPLGSALPKWALVVIKPDKVSNAGLIRFNAIRATVNGQDRQLPDGIHVVATDGGFIKASQKRPGAGFNFGDVFGVLLGGAKTATSLINQPTTSSSFSSTGGTIQSVSNANPNILAAFGQGAADTLLNRAQSRVQQVQTTRSPYFLIGDGTEVKLLVTQTISM